MIEVGVRELKASLSEYLRRVGRGERLRVTVRGRHVADIVPAGEGQAADGWRRLIAEGRVTPAAAPLPVRAPRPVRAKGSITDLVLSERTEER
jgi:prevent-host-death family protein